MTTISVLPKNLPVFKKPAGAMALPDNDQWRYRFEIRSQTSNRVYIVSQNKNKKHWGCSCPSYRVRRYCKHLQIIGLPCYEKPFEVEYKN